MPWLTDGRSTIDLFGGGRVETHQVVGAGHYLYGQPTQLKQVVDLTVGFMTGLA